MSDEQSYHETRQERRERKLQAKHERMQQHGAGLRRNVVDAALRMARKQLRRPPRR